MGVTKVKSWAQMKEAVELAAGYDAEVLCEEFIDGDEVTVAVLGSGMDTMALPVVRIVAPEGKYDLQNKYFTDVVKYHCPSGLPDAEEKAVQRLAVAAYRALDCRGWSRASGRRGGRRTPRRSRTPRTARSHPAPCRRGCDRRARGACPAP